MSAGHAADELHLCGIVEVGVGHVFLEIHLGQIVLRVEAIAHELMILHHGLHLVQSAQHAEGELTLEVRLYGSAGRAHLAAVNLEVSTLDGYAGAMIHHQSRELDTVDDGEVAVPLVVRLKVEGDGQSLLAFLRQVVASDARHGHGVSSLLVAPVGQTVHAVESALVGHAAAALVGVGPVAIL